MGSCCAKNRAGTKIDTQEHHMQDIAQERPADESAARPLPLQRSSEPVPDPQAQFTERVLLLRSPCNEVNVRHAHRGIFG
ncbi:MAG: hypothetical protein P4M11_04725 [Candidatus Pacebacteria bacterium]|nr:hypothetical protein [Candidatus Paceibacterota bacterium]